MNRHSCNPIAAPLGELLDLVPEGRNPEGHNWSLYLGTWRLYRGLSLTTALRIAGFNVQEAR
jgi:hypothetical protein